MALDEERESRAADESRRLHARALAGDRTVSGEVWERWYTGLVRQLRVKFPVLDDTAIHDAVSDVIFDYIERPARYDPAKAPLDRYLLMAARGDLLNLLQKRKRQPTVIPLDPVAHDRPARNTVQEDEERENWLRAYLHVALSWEEFMRRLGEVLPDPLDREVLDLMAEGERATTRFAMLIGCADLDEAEQRKHVKQTKDRIRARLRRHGFPSHG